MLFPCLKKTEHWPDYPLISPVHEVYEVPPGHDALPLVVADVLHVGRAEELHAHDGKDEDDDAQHKGQVGQGAERVGHDGEDVVETLPRLGQFEHPQQPERPEHGESGDALGQELHQGEDHDQEVEAIPALLQGKRPLKK